MTPIWNKPLAWLVDGAMCNMMHALQWRRRTDTCTREELASYIARHAPMTREEFYEMFAFNMRNYDALRKQYNCEAAFPHVYDKISQAARN